MRTRIHLRRALGRVRALGLAGFLFLAALAAEQAPGSIVGRVTDRAGNPLAGAAVTVARTDSAGVRGSTRTSETGGFQFAGLPPGSYTVTAEQAGYLPGGERVALDAGKRHTVILRLQRAR
ncbi:MAG TPA: carboxypeptidase-like regulatory domain-containing protein [Longimicrobiaceae bacterium]|nr:carboxypeptidase-like regulatory domain-containing protein [Longimicrobiaceae bacterium]